MIRLANHYPKTAPGIQCECECGFPRNGVTFVTFAAYSICFSQRRKDAKGFTLRIQCERESGV